MAARRHPRESGHQLPTSLSQRDNPDTPGVAAVHRRSARNGGTPRQTRDIRANPGRANGHQYLCRMDNPGRHGKYAAQAFIFTFFCAVLTRGNHLHGSPSGHGDRRRGLTGAPTAAILRVRSGQQATTHTIVTVCNTAHLAPDLRNQEVRRPWKASTTFSAGPVTGGESSAAKRASAPVCAAP